MAAQSVLAVDVDPFLDALDENLKQISPDVESLLDDPLPLHRVVCSTLKLTEYFSLVVQHHASDFVNPHRIRQVRLRLWQILLTHRGRFDSKYIVMGEATPDDNFSLYELYFILMAAASVATFETKSSEQKQTLLATTIRSIVGLAAEHYIESLADLVIMKFSMRELRQALLVVATTSTQCTYSAALAQYIDMLETRVCEFVYYAMPEHEHDMPEHRTRIRLQDARAAATNNAREDEQPRALCTIKYSYIRFMLPVLVDLRHKLSSRTLLPQNVDDCDLRQFSITEETIRRCRLWFLDRVQRLANREASSTMRLRYLQTQIRPGERQAYHLKDPFAVGTDQHILKEFRGDAQFNSIYEQCSRTLFDIIHQELTADGPRNESIALQMCLYDVSCMYFQSLDMDRIVWGRSVIWEWHHNQRYEELSNEQDERPFLVQAHNHMQVAFKDQMYWLNSYVYSFLLWLYHTINSGAFKQRDILANDEAEEDVPMIMDRPKSELVELWERFQGKGAPIECTPAAAATAASSLSAAQTVRADAASIPFKME